MLGDDELNPRESGSERPTRLVRHQEGMPAPHRDPMGYEWGEVQENPVQFDFRTYLRLVLRHWLLIASAVILALAVGVAHFLLTTPLYTAAGTLQIDREAARVSNMETFEGKESVGNNADEFFQTQFALLKSQSLAEATARDTRNALAQDRELLRGLGLVKDNQRLTTAEAEAALTRYIQRHLEVSQLQRSRIVELSIVSPSPQASARLVNAVAENFIKQTLARRIQASSYGAEFLDEEIAKTKQKLEDSEQQLNAYARAEQIVTISPGSAASAGGGGAATSTGSSGSNQTLVAASLSAAMAARDTARNARIAAQQKRDRQAVTANSPQVLQNQVIQNLKVERTRLQGERSRQFSAFKASEPEVAQLDAQIAAVDAQIRTETENLVASLNSALDAEYNAALGNEQKLNDEVRRLNAGVMDIRTRSIRYDILQREVDRNRLLYDDLLQRAGEIGVSGRLQTNNISIVDRAVAPARPSEPKLLRNLLIAAILGLILGLGVAMLVEFLDESIRTPDDVEGKLGLPLLGSIPKLEKGASVDEALADIRSPFSEAYYSVRTALQFSTNEGVPSSLAVTSSRPSEGKSTSASTIAKNFARLGSRVLLVDADLRNPSLHRVMKTDNAEGLSNYLTGGKSLRQLAQATDTPNLYFISCGPLPPNPAELLGGHKLDAMLKEARESFDMVVLDCPPVLGLADAPLLASAAAGTVLIVEAGGTGRHHAKATIRRLSVGNARILGILLTKFDARRSSYGYGYGYGYAYDYTYGDSHKAIGKK